MLGDEAKIRQSIVDNISALLERRRAGRKSGKRTEMDEAIAQIARGIADGRY